MSGTQDGKKAIFNIISSTNDKRGNVQWSMTFEKNGNDVKLVALSATVDATGLESFTNGTCVLFNV